MKALILVGGFGTRLRPLTLTVPKPCVEFANLPIVCHQIKALAEAGVTEVILAVNYHSDQMEASLKKYETEYGVKITCSLEDEPMGTAGPIRLAKDLILEGNDEGLLFVFNSDIICDFPIKDMIAYHKSHGAEGTLMVTEVEDPSRFGVIVSDEDGTINRFVEKPTDFVSNKINAGLYLFNTSIIDRIPLKPTSIEREIFPVMAKDKALYSMVLDGFWMDIGQPKDFLKGTQMYLDFLESKACETLATGEHIKGNVVIHPTATIDESALIGPNVSIGENCVIEAGARIQNSVILPNAKICAHSWIAGSLIGWHSVIGKWCRIEALTIVAEDVRVGDEVFINGCFILPHK
jgi:mannose-1-phosphate guanylyltransferase